MSSTDTIVAVSSPPGASRRGLLRLSGTSAKALASRLLADAAPILSKPRHLLASRLREPDLACLAVFFPSPGSYTGDDLLEIQVPGHPALLEQLTRAALDHGARLAEPGEFTFRAYLAGKLSLTEAEGVAATVSAVSDAQLHAAAHLREGRFAGVCRQLVDTLGTTLALVEAGIDFVDQEDVVPIPADALAERLDELTASMASLLSRSRSWGAVGSPPRVVLVGPPSCGKSTLFNALLGDARAVTHDQPGTTRDILEEPLVLNRPGGGAIEVMLIDIAGLDDGATLLDRHAQDMAQRELDRADVLVCFAEPPADTRGSVIRVTPKGDLAQGSDADPLPVSGLTGLNLARLRAAIAESLSGIESSPSAEALVLQPRHEQSLRDALQDLQAARDLLGVVSVETAGGGGPLGDIELIAGRMRSALDALAALGGEMTPDDVIGRVFATFCVGK